MLAQSGKIMVFQVFPFCPGNDGGMGIRAKYVFWKDKPTDGFFNTIRIDPAYFGHFHGWVAFSVGSYHNGNLIVAGTSFCSPVAWPFIGFPAQVPFPFVADVQLFVITLNDPGKCLAIFQGQRRKQFVPPIKDRFHVHTNYR
jgi:hypothetical protein